MSEEEHRLETRVPSFMAALILPGLAGVVLILAGIIAVWLVLR
jgi:hypothetical protein